MSIGLTAVAGVAAAAVVGASLVGCSSNSKSSITSSAARSPATSRSTAAASAQPSATDYRKLLIKASDINAPIVFSGGPITQNPNGSPGVEQTFSDADGAHAIRDTITVMNDPAAAADALESAKATLGDLVAGMPAPAGVGTGGTTVSGNSPDGSKGVTMLLFTEGKAFTTLKFDGPRNASAPPDFVTDVAQKQDTAIKTGLPGQ